MQPSALPHTFLTHDAAECIIVSYCRLLLYVNIIISDTNLYVQWWCFINKDVHETF